MNFIVYKCYGYMKIGYRKCSNFLVVIKLFKLFIGIGFMDGWKYWMEKNVFLRTKHNRVYSGKVLSVEQNKGSQLVWITLLDKYDKRVTFVQTEILEIKEEEVRE